MDKLLQRELQRGHPSPMRFFQTDSPVPKRTYYAKDGRAMVLPADAYSMQHYLEAGLTLTPPANPVAPLQIDVEKLVPQVSEAVADKEECDICGYIAKDHVGLGIHKRKKHNIRRKYQPAGASSEKPSAEAQAQPLKPIPNG